MKIWKTCFLFSLGGSLYAIVELLWRGRTYGSMFFLGGGCFLLLGRLRKLPLVLPIRVLCGTLSVTAAELATGLWINRTFRIWDYRNLPLNFRGQICLPYTLLWMPLCMFAMWLHGIVEKNLG